MNKKIHQNLEQCNKLIYVPLFLNISSIEKEKESQDYDAARFNLGTAKIIFRTAKITPAKIGQFVTLWKRKQGKPIEPLNEKDDFDFVIINTQFQNKLGQFIFPKTVLSQKGIISSTFKDGKRALRVYPSWDQPTSKQAITTKNWQKNYFIEVKEPMNSDQLDFFSHIIKNKISQ